MANRSLHRVHLSHEDLLALLDMANRTIRTLERRVAMQERSYVAAMQEKNREIRELQLSLQAGSHGIASNAAGSQVVVRKRSTAHDGD